MVKRYRNSPSIIIWSIGNREQVGSAIERSATESLRRHIPHGPNHVPGLRQSVLPVDLLVVGDAKVQQLGLVVLLHDHIGRLDIAVDDVIAVGVTQGQANLLDHGQFGGYREIAIGLNDPLQRFTGDELHDDIRKPVLLAHVVHNNNVRMHQRPGLCRLPVESPQHFLVLDETFGEGLDRNLTPQMPVEAEIDNTHPTAAKDLGHFVLPDL